jgi:diguanylate cyclase (GGDEF)-like protein
VRRGVLGDTICKDGFLKFGEREYRRLSEHFNIAVYQNRTDIIPHIPDTVLWSELNIHRFAAFDELSQLAQKHILDLIMFATEGRLEEEAVMISRAKERPALATVPTIVYHPSADKSTFADALEAGADDVLTGEWDSEVIAIKMQMITQRSNRDLGVNPTSRLPGPVLIERELETRISSGEEFAVCYLDIDNFKSYNDYYGYLYGDKVIRLTAHIVRDIVLDLVPDGFIGHVGGDDFIFIIPYDNVEIVNSNIIKTFDSIIPYKYKGVDRERGRIVAKNRKGEDEVFPLLTISIAVVVNHDKMFTHVGELSHMLADLKNYTKKLAGSNYMIERRRKY